MRNVNEQKKELDKRESDCFILTMRNVNFELPVKFPPSIGRFILTMRNVNSFIFMTKHHLTRFYINYEECKWES